MTASFNAGNPGAPAREGDQTFNANGDVPNDQNNGDNAVVFEHQGRKFTAADLRKKLEHADTFIDDLKGQVKTQGELLDKANTALGRQISALEVLQRVQNPGAAQQPENQQQQVQQPPVVQIDPDAIAKQVMDSLTVAQTKASQDKNFQNVATALTQAYGEKVDETVRKTCEELGISYDDGVALARKSPNAFLKMFPAVGAPAQQSIAPRGFNTQSFKNTQQKGPSGYVGAKNSAARTKAYLDRLAAT